MACDSPYMALQKNGGPRVPVPCGKCVSCKATRVNGWVFRLLQEDKRSTSSYFVTLTYDTSTIPISKNRYMTLRKKDLQNYFKRLRKLNPDAKIKYYACGEYGSQNMRPHYHAIIFNSNPADIEAAWFLNSAPIGIVHIGSVSGDSIAYTCKYIDKPAVLKLHRHSRDDRQKEFSLMSKGIGSNYINEESRSYHSADVTRRYLTREGGYRVAMPKYYVDRLYNDEQKKQYLEKVEKIIGENYEKSFLSFTFTAPHGFNTREHYEALLSRQSWARNYRFHHHSKTRKL